MKHIARSIVFSLLGFAWSVILALAVTPYIVQGLGKAAYGVWALVGNVVGYMAIFNSLQTAGTKYLAEYIAINDRDSIRKLKGTSLIFNLLVGALGGCGIFLFAEPLVIDVFKVPIQLHAESVVAFRLAGLGFCLGTVGWWGGAILVGVQRFDWVMGISIATNTVSTLGSLLSVRMGWGVIGVIAANVTGAVLSIILYWWSVQSLLPDKNWVFAIDGAMFRRILSYGFFSTLHVVFGVMMSQLDRTLLGIWIGVAAVTTYSIPLSIATRIHQLCAKALEVVFPLSSGLETQSRTEQIRRLFLRAQNLNVVLVVMLSVPLMILAPEILRFWISGNFAVEAALVFRLLVIAYALLALNVVMAGMVAGFGHPEVNTAFVVLLGLSNLLGYFLLIPSYGVNGAGMASAFGSLVSVPVFLWYVNHRFLKVPLPEVFIVTIIRPTFAGFIMGVCLFLARPFITGIPTLFLVLSGGCIIFFVMTILLGVWQAQELEILRQVWSRVVPSHIFRN